MDAVSAVELAVLEAFFNVHGIIVLVALDIRLLYAAAGGCEIVGDGETNH